MSATTDLCFTPATVLREEIRAKRLSPVELLEAVLARHAEVEPKIHAFVTMDEDNARASAREAEAAVMRGDDLGALHGIPVSIKDLFATKGLRTTNGTRFFENNVPDFDASSVERIRKSGAVIFGKTNTPAFGHKDTCDNLVMEATRNPWKLDRTSGASSGGAGASVAAGVGPLALGSDGAGSIRIPAALCGIYGIKPSFGRVPFWPAADYWTTRSHIGPMTRTVRDAAMMLAVMAGPDHRDPLSIDATPDDYEAACDGDLSGLRVAWSADFGYAPVDPEVRKLTEAAARRFEEFGCEVVEATPEWDNPVDWHATLYRAGISAKYGPLITERPEWVDPSLAIIIELGKEITTTQLLGALTARGRFYDQARAFMDQYDLLLTPAMPSGAWKYDLQPGEIDGQLVQQISGGRWPFMFPFNVTGWPASSVPCGFTSEGLPVGLQIVAPWHQDSLCLRASAAFEAAQPWADQRPPL
jgi:aspartyl-tRNA(Asn)/glutamyl-tRNA(Gln) amidotransferase subunit A